MLFRHDSQRQEFPWPSLNNTLSSSPPTSRDPTYRTLYLSSTLIHSLSPDIPYTAHALLLLSYTRVPCPTISLHPLLHRPHSFCPLLCPLPGSLPNYSQCSPHPSPFLPPHTLLPPPSPTLLIPPLIPSYPLCILCLPHPPSLTIFPTPSLLTILLPLPPALPTVLPPPLFHPLYSLSLW